VRKAVRSIGRLAIKVSGAADDCIKVLVELIENKVTYVVQEAIVVIRDVFRRYPDRYEKIIPTLCESLDLLDEPEAKAAIIWIVGQYTERIENAEDLMENLTYSFLEECTEVRPVSLTCGPLTALQQVQLALVTASVKFFIQRPNQGQKLVQKVLKWATEDIDNPDLRDRGYMYWRLLATNAGAAKGIVMGERPPVNTDTDRMELGALDQLLLHTGTLGSIYHKTPETFIRHAKGKALPDSPALNAASKRVLSESTNGSSSPPPPNELNIP
jgi:AP-2 complex subunit beta-1